MEVGINANLRRYRFSGALLSARSVSKRIVRLHDANRRMGRRIIRKNKIASARDRGAKALWLCGYKVGKVYYLASNWNHGSKPGRKNKKEILRWSSSRQAQNCNLVNRTRFLEEIIE